MAAMHPIWVASVRNSIQTALQTQIARFVGPSWGPPGSCQPQMGPMLTPWTLLAGKGYHCLCSDFPNHQYWPYNVLHSISVVVFGVDGWWQLLQWCVNGWQLLLESIIIHATSLWSHLIMIETFVIPVTVIAGIHYHNHSEHTIVWCPRTSSHYNWDFCDTSDSHCQNPLS